MSKKKKNKITVDDSTVEVETEQKSKKQRKAEERKAIAEARKAQLEIEKIQIEIYLNGIELERKQNEYRFETAGDLENRIYRFDEAVTFDSTSACIDTLSRWSRLYPGGDMEIVLNSPGGYLSSTFAMYDHIMLLRSMGHKITIGTTGMAASGAGIILMAGTTRWIGPESTILIHRMSAGTWGTLYEMEDDLKYYKSAEKQMLRTYTQNSKLSEKKIKKNWKRKDWWIGADKALEYGLVEEIRKPGKRH